MDFLDRLEVLDSRTAPDGSVVEILELTQLRGSADVRTAESLYFANQTGLRLKMVRIILNAGRVRIEPGALYYMRGDLKMTASTGGGLMKGLVRAAAAGETFFISEITGSGEIYLEPTFGHFFLHNVSPEEGGVIVDKGLFYAGTSGLDVHAAMQQNISSAIFGGEGLFQTGISGSGIAVLYSPVPQEEVQRFELRGEKLSVDGNFALMRSKQITFKAEKSSKGLLSTAASGEGLLSTFAGTGFVWIAPTQGVYEKLVARAGLQSLSGPPGSSGTLTTTSSGPAGRPKLGCLGMTTALFGLLMVGAAVMASFI